MTRHLLFFIICFAVSINMMPVSATIINVPDDYLTIQQGIDASTDGDTVLVQPGTYMENINFNGHNIVLGSLFLMTGDTTYISETIIDGDSAGPVVTFINGENSMAVISGFTIRAGYYVCAGGIVCSDSSNPQITYNIIMDNSAEEFGGGIYCYDSSPLITGNTITENVAGFGAGIYAVSSRAHIENNKIIDNTSNHWGGGVHLTGSNAVFRGNMVVSNESGRNGGGISLSSSAALITGNVIADNIASHWGGGIFCEFHSDFLMANNLVVGNTALWGGGALIDLQSDATVVNNLFTANTASEIGGGLFVYLSDPLVTNNIIIDNSAVTDAQVHVRFGEPMITYCNIQGGWGGEGNIDVDPLFRDPHNGDFHLMSAACGDSLDSPCIDTGHPDILDSLLDCSWGLGTIRSDMGAYGGGDSVTVGIDFSDISLPGELSISQNYPNPFNAMTVIRYSLPEAADVKIEIYDILGRKVETLISEQQQAGYYQVIWDVGPYSSGIYFYRLNAGDLVETKRMLLLK